MPWLWRRSLPSSPHANHDSHTQSGGSGRLIQHLTTNTKGLTLVEVMITTALMSMGLLAVANMQIVSMQVNTASSKLAQATMTTQEVMERLISLPFNHPDLTDLTAPGLTTTYDYPNPPQGYSISWEVEAYGNNTKNVYIIAAWGPVDEDTGKQKSLVLPMQLSTISNPKSDQPYEY